MGIRPDTANKALMFQNKSPGAFNRMLKGAQKDYVGAKHGLATSTGINCFEIAGLAKSFVEDPNATDKRRRFRLATTPEFGVGDGGAAAGKTARLQGFHDALRCDATLEKANSDSPIQNSRSFIAKVIASAERGIRGDFATASVSEKEIAPMVDAFDSSKEPAEKFLIASVARAWLKKLGPSADLRPEARKALRRIAQEGDRVPESVKKDCGQYTAILSAVATRDVDAIIDSFSQLDYAHSSVAGPALCEKLFSKPFKGRGSLGGDDATRLYTVIAWPSLDTQRMKLLNSAVDRFVEGNAKAGDSFDSGQADFVLNRIDAFNPRDRSVAAERIKRRLFAGQEPSVPMADEVGSTLYSALMQTIETQT